MDMTVDELKQLCKRTGHKELPTRKAELVRVLMRYMKPERLRAVFEGLDEIQRAAVSEVVHGSSAKFVADRFRAKYGKEPHWGVSDEHRSTPAALGLFLPTNYQMPDDLRARLRSVVPKPRADQVQAAETLPTDEELTVRESERGAQAELFTVLRLIDGGKLSASAATGKPSGASLQTLAAVLEGGDYYPSAASKHKHADEDEPGPIRAFAWPMLLQAGGLAQLAGSKLELTKVGRRALGEPAAPTLKLLWNKWLGSRLLDELSRIDCIKGQGGKGGNALSAVAGRRALIVEALQSCPQGKWVTPQELQRFLEGSQELVISRNPWHLYIADPQYGSLGYEGYSDVLPERYLLAFLFEYVATLGLIDVAYEHPEGALPNYRSMWGTDELPFLSRYDGLDYFRVNALGAYCLGLTASYTPPALQKKPVLRLLPNLEIAAVGAGLDAGDCLALDAYAVRVSDRLWRLERTRLLEALEAGRTIGQIREFLEARSEGAPPETVIGLLQDTHARSTRIQDCGAARLYECEDEALAALIANDSRTRRLCLRAGDTHLVVPADSDSAFRKGLRALGYLAAEGARVRSRRQTSADEADGE